jgi:hypothetical protein
LICSGTALAVERGADAAMDRAVGVVYGSTMRRPKGYPLDKIWTIYI